jgi:peptidoglycan/xylan/chitin deacetylase (PgdA/CDA1 family)
MASGTLVLLYHRVAQLDRDPYGLAVHPRRFAEQCRVLRRRCEVVPLQETNGDRGQVAITFDDGYVDNGGAARDILAAAALPATFFVTSGRLGERAEIWWDRLEHMLLGYEPATDYLELEIGRQRFWGDIRSASARARVHMALYWRLRPFPVPMIASVLTEVETQLGIERAEREPHRWMNVDELCTLSKTAGVDVGAHTLTHPWLAALAASEQRVEIEGSRSRLEQLLNKPVRAFSYPYGSNDAYDAATTELVRKAGYALACTSGGGLARPEHYPFRIPRNVVGDWDGSTFEHWLDRWMAG